MNWKQIILCVTETAGLNRLAGYWTQHRLLGLCYHSVVSDNVPKNDARTRIAVTVSQFDEQLRELQKHWNPVSLKQIRDAVENNIPLPNRAVHISFDDGYRNNLTFAAPLLARYNIPATIFVTTNLISTRYQMIWALEFHERLTALPDSEFEIGGQTFLLPPPESSNRSEIALELLNCVKRLGVQEQDFLLQKLRNRVEIDFVPYWKQELYEFLNWDEIRLLRDQGIEIGSHSLSHPVLASLDQTELNCQLYESKKCIERELETECDVLAYPFGSADDFSDTVVDTARQVGFRLAFTLQDCRNSNKLDAMRIHRICINREHSINSFRALISGLRNIF
ncbi:MAG: polysaccharide deacetylase family protein [Planctomycetaceae bacterium]|jgi:peptidoglycan/xylan/chitin deacetylase (PgdA/CDA1 family)|nr:polysaccharide deacetylase family protein [Planctomycetaceae bacterium]